MITRAMAREALGHCRKGLKASCDTYGLDWEKFCTVGIDEKDILKTGDARAQKLVEAVKNGKQ